MTIRKALFAVAIALGATAVHADNNWAFDDGYWKAAQTAQAVQSTRAAEAQGKYDQVDRYNP